MQKLGRNDFCHCGSGKKYKKCCLEKDEAGNVTHITAKTGSAPVNLIGFIESELSWKNELYKFVALHILREFSDFYKPEEIAIAIEIWNDYSNEEEPEIKKAGIFPAAMEYYISQVFGYEITKASLAAKYNVSAGSITQRAAQIIEFASYKVEQRRLSKQAPQQQQPPAIGRMGMERELQSLGALLADQNFATMEEANAFLNNHLNQPASSKTKKSSASPKQRAQDLLFTAWEEASPEKRVKLANQAIEIYPNSTDAYNILAENDAETLKASANYYKIGMLVGEKDLGDGFSLENTGRFWGITETRPYMRAKLGYANAIAQMGKADEAIQHYQELLKLNPNDNQGVRDMLSLSYLETKQWKKATALYKEYKDDNSASLNYDRILAEFGLNGITPKLSTLLKAAVQQNPHVSGYLSGKKRLPREIPDYMGYGDAAEAIVYTHNHKDLWQSTPELLQWLIKQS